MHEIRIAALAAAFALLLFGAPAANATDWYDDEYAQCREGPTVAIVQCVEFPEATTDILAQPRADFHWGRTVCGDR